MRPVRDRGPNYKPSGDVRVIHTGITCDQILCYVSIVFLHNFIAMSVRRDAFRLV